MNFLEAKENFVSAPTVTEQVTQDLPKLPSVNTQPAQEKEQVTMTKTQLLRKNLRQYTNELVEIAKNNGRTDVRYNQLLLEAYNLVGKMVDTFEGWTKHNYHILRGEHGYPIWGTPIASKDGTFQYCPVKIVFSQDQVELITNEFDE